MKIVTLSILVVLLAAAVGLVATNPTTDQYTRFLEAVLSQALDKMDATETAETPSERKLIRDLLKSQGSKVIQSLARSNTTRKDYGLFSVFETRAFGVRVQVLGIASRFMPLEDEQVLIRKLGQAIL